MMRWLLLLLIFSPVVQAQQDILLDKFLLMSGLDGVVASYPGQLDAQFGASGGARLGDKTRQRARQRLLDAYNEIDGPAVLRSYVASELSRDDVRAIVVWFESPLGQRLMLAEQQAGTVAGVKAKGKYLSQLDNNPMEDERIDLVHDFEKTARLTAINLSIIKVMLETELLAVNAVAAKDERQTSSQLSKTMYQQFYDMRAMMLPGLSVQMLSVSYYVLSSFSNDEIQAYINFLHSAAGRELIALYERVPVYVFGQVVRRAVIDVPSDFLRLP